MPRIAEIVTLPDGRLAVVLEIEGDQGSLTIWSGAEVEDCKRRSASEEREECALVADAYSQVDGAAHVVGTNIGQLIRLRSTSI
jgi:hypothetical protein